MSKAGFSVADVTPDKPVFLAGYPNRRIPSEGVDDPLCLRIMALEDEHGRRAVVVTADLLKFPKDMAWRTKIWAEQTLGLPIASLVINLSHTHSAPGLFYQECYPHWALDVGYVRDLEVTIRAGIEQAIADLRPMRIRYGVNDAHFGVCRRNPNPELPGKVRLGANPERYYDPEMPILAFHCPEDNKLAAIFYSYGCHATSKSGNRVSADYPGEISRALRNTFGPDLVTLFAQGAGGSIMTRERYRGDDQQAAYREYWEQQARRIAEFVRSDRMRDLDLSIASTEREFAIPYDQAEIPSFERLLDYANPTEPPLDRFVSPANREIVRLWAAGILEKIRTGTLPESFGMHVTRIKLAERLNLIGLSGEVTADVGRLIKDAETDETIFLGYCSYTDAYIPTAAMLPEDGHEATYSMYFHMRPAPFVKDIDEILVREVAATRLD